MATNYQLPTTNYYDVIIIGAGHAGCEAANAAAKMGAKTLLLTTSLDTIGLLACSPSFGGPGRGQLLREIDALGGLMSSVIDKTAIHFRHSGNTASRVPFAVCDRLHYHRYLKSKVENINNLDIKQDTVASIGPVKSGWEVKTATGQSFSAQCLVIAAGTFLKGRTSFGKTQEKAGRNNEIAADELTKSLVGLGFKMGIFRTGTGPTVKIDRIEDDLEEQVFDKKPLFFSSNTPPETKEQVPTYKTHTSLATLKIVKEQAVNKQALGPRYCPSLLDKVIKFPEKKEHPVFIQPESLDCQEWFLNGASMDFDEETQQKVVTSIKGLSRAQIVKFGYSVSYHYVKSGQLMSNLESKKYTGLFFAGQVTGSNGYEEAAALGLIAGKNAALKAKKQPGAVLDRRNSFIGTLVSDITSKTITEPYRMLLSRVAGQDISYDNIAIPYSTDFSRACRQAGMIGLSKEAIEKLERFRPPTIKDALMLDIPERSVRALALYLERINK